MKFKKLSFQKKLYLSCFTLNLLLLFICSFVFYRYTASALKQNMHDSVINNTSTLSKNLDALINSSDNILKELQTNPALIRDARKIQETSANYFSTHVPVSSLFQNTFRNVLLSQDISGSLIYVSRYYDNVGVSSSKTGVHNYVHKENLANQKPLSTLINEIKYVEYLLPHTDFWGHKDTVFSVVRSMRDTYQSYGILELDLDISMLDNLLDDFENPEIYSITLLNQDKKMAYSSGKDTEGKIIYAGYLEAASDTNTDIFSPDDLHLSCFLTSPVTGWTFILTSSTAGYLQSLKNMLFLTVVIFFTLFVVISSFLYLVTNRLTKPLKVLTNQLVTLEPGRNINISQISSDNEITMLTNAVQAFLAEIYDQNQRLTESSKRALEAHYDALESQLNPHFLYNTLSVIGMAGLNSGNTNVSTMCIELANLLRYSLSFTGQSVKLSQEINNGESYLYIMKMRYEDDLATEWQMDSSLNAMLVPKLILQPLLENCFQHGFQGTEQEVPPPWRIKIHSHKDECNWYLSVSNNGASFKTDTLQKLYERIRQFNLSDFAQSASDNIILRQGYGLENTILRLNIYYQGKEFFQVSSSQEGWTTVTIGGPLNPAELFSRGAA